MTLLAERVHRKNSGKGLKTVLETDGVRKSSWRLTGAEQAILRVLNGEATVGPVWDIK